MSGGTGGARTPGGRLPWGMIGGGEGSQIGDAHRIAAGMDGLFSLAAAVPDVDPGRGRAFARRLGVAGDRAYPDWEAFVDGEGSRADGVRAVTVATPNATHYPIARACLEAGLDVLCEKPLTMTVEEAVALRDLAATSGRVLAVNFGYTGYPMVRQARAMVARGTLGDVRLVRAQFAHGHHADAADADNPRVRWRYDPAQAGVSSVLADCGIHAQHMAGWVLGQRVSRLSAHYVSAVPGRELEDDASVQSEHEGGTVTRLWASAVALGRLHGLELEVFGSKGALAWRQEQPNQLLHTPLGKPVRTLERGQDGLHADARDASRIAIAHPEGMLEAFANVYRDLHAAVAARGRRREHALARLPSAEDGVEMVRFVERATRSARRGSQWVAMR